MTSVGLWGCNLGAEGAGAARSEALTSVDLQYNSLGSDGKAALQEAVRGREGFELKV